MPKLVAVHAGRPQLLDDPFKAGKQWRTGYAKAPVTGSVFVSRLNLAGDGQAAPFHGGEEMAVLAYAAAHYVDWQRELNIPGFGPGAFAENLTIEGLDEDTVCIGDTLEVGSVQLQVTQRRNPCVNIAKRWGSRELLRRVEETGRSGWYLRVLREGELENGQAVEVLARPNPDWSVRRAARVYWNVPDDQAEARALAALPELSSHWREHLETKLAELAGR
jgi:MOSC domain-containing protein YiiM